MRNKIIFSLLLVSCSPENSVDNKAEEVLIKREICSQIKSALCDKLSYCNIISIEKCNLIAMSNNQCENSSSTIDELLVCKDLINLSSCGEPLPEYCSELEDGA
jgi:hypothetical protein